MAIYRIGIVSRIDVLSPGARYGLWPLVKSIFRRFDALYVVMSGGLISRKHYGEKRKHLRAEVLAGFKNAPPKSHEDTISELYMRMEEKLKYDVAREIAQEFPSFVNSNGEIVKTYIVTAPASNYDGAVGAEIAGIVGTLREDIVFWGEKDQRFVIKALHRPDGTNPQIQFVLPVKSVWRSKYYSTSAQRLVEDKAMQSAQRPPELWVAGCAAIGLVLPAVGERKIPIFSFPGLHRLQEVIVSENQVGVGIIEFSDDDTPPRAWFVSLKDLVSTERLFIPVPETASGVQQQIIAQIKVGPSTIGILEDATGVPRERILDELRDYEIRKLEPPIHLYHERGHNYDFEQEWISSRLAYPEIDFASLEEEVVAGFSCMHAGHRSTQYGWWIREVPKLILRHGAKVIVCCGDKIAGHKHSLHFRGEIIAGLNYTQQELLVARMEGFVIFEVFKARFREKVEHSKERLDEKSLIMMIEDALPRFLHFYGNHDKWLMDHGVQPFATSTPEMIRYLTEKIVNYLRELKIGFLNFVSVVEAIVRRHAVFGHTHTLGSGLVMGINHPEMARSPTASLRAQQVLNYRPDCHICQFGNFHAAKAVLEWNWQMGERVAIDNGSILAFTQFEDGKLKRLDTAVSFLKIWSKDQRIIVAQPLFEGPDIVKNEYDEGDFGDLLPEIDLSWKILRKFPNL